MKWIEVNGDLIKATEPFISVDDRGFLFGEGVFTTLRVCQGKTEWLQSHLQRLKEHCDQLHLKSPIITSERIQRLIDCNQAHEGTWKCKIIVTEKHHILLIEPYSFSPWQSCHLAIYPGSIQRPCSQLKTLAYIDRFFVQREAQNKKYEDAIVLSIEGYVLETAFSNFFWSDGKQIFVPHFSLPYLKGIFLTQVIQEQKLLPICWANSQIQDISDQAVVYICNSLTHIRPVIAIENRFFTRNVELEKQFDDWIQTFLLNDQSSIVIPSIL
jgi:4-amino-4-deoxychorismate lyase